MFNPEMKVVAFDVADIITVSGGNTCGNDDCPNDVGEF